MLAVKSYFCQKYHIAYSHLRKWYIYFWLLVTKLIIKKWVLPHKRRSKNVLFYLDNFPHISNFTNTVLKYICAKYSKKFQLCAVQRPYTGYYATRLRYQATTYNVTFWVCNHRENLLFNYVEIVWKIKQGVTCLA